ncbi:MAG: BamA/TamA family outer membrane protein [Deltaproteobacteria bacterium]|nr:BamA/TamA family outer membrane protein [Deltaproteobacteria bacterium]
MNRILILAAVIVVAGTRTAPAAATSPNDQASAEGDGEAAAELEGEPVTELQAPVPFTEPSFGPRYTIQRIDVRGNRKTETVLILGELGLQPGDQVTASDPRVEAARIRLLSLGFFLDVHLALGKGSGRGDAVLIVEVEERGTVILNALYLGSSAATSFWGGMEIAENNLLGRGISLGTGFVASSRPNVAEADRNLGARVRTLVPPLGGTGLMISGTGLLVSGSEFFRTTGAADNADPNQFVALRIQRVGGIVGVGRALTQSSRLFLDFRQEGVSSDLPTLRQRTTPSGGTAPIDFGVHNGFSRVGSITATLDFDTRSDPLVPRGGSHVALSVEGATWNLLSNYEFLKVVLQGSFYRPTRRGHVIGFHAFGGALLGSAPLFDRFFVGDMNLMLPPRALGLNFSTQPSRDFLGTSIASHRYDNFAGRVLVEYAVPLWRRRRLIYSGDVFVALGAFGMGSKGAFRDPTRTGLGAWPVDVTGDLGVRLDTMVGVFTLSFANALGRIPF